LHCSLQLVVNLSGALRSAIAHPAVTLSAQVARQQSEDVAAKVIYFFFPVSCLIK
jgi:hypothetical protein